MGNMGIAAMILGIISLVISLTLILNGPQIFIPGILKIAIGSSASITGLVLGIIALVKSKTNRPMAVAGVIMCSLGIIWPAIGLVIVLGTK
jgi:predicted ribosome-associated RNA-binding protein Tma20